MFSLFTITKKFCGYVYFSFFFKKQFIQENAQILSVQFKAFDKV